MQKTLKRLLKLSVLMLVLTLVVVAAYLITLRYYEGKEGANSVQSAVGTESIEGLFSKEEEKPEKRKKSIVADLLAGKEEKEGQPAGKLTNLIYSYEKESKMLTAFVLEVWDEKNRELSYITVPADTGYTISAGLYRQLSAEEPEVPQRMRLFNLYHYYNNKNAFPVGVLVLEEVLDIDISSYTMMEEAAFQKLFRQTEKGKWKLKKKQAEELEKMDTAIKTNFFLLPGKSYNAGYEEDRKQMWEKLGGIVDFKHFGME